MLYFVQYSLCGLGGRAQMLHKELQHFRLGSAATGGVQQTGSMLDRPAANQRMQVAQPPVTLPQPRNPPVTPSPVTSPPVASSLARNTHSHRPSRVTPRRASPRSAISSLVTLSHSPRPQDVYCLRNARGEQPFLSAKRFEKYGVLLKPT